MHAQRKLRTAMLFLIGALIIQSSHALSVEKYLDSVQSPSKSNANNKAPLGRSLGVHQYSFNPATSQMVESIVVNFYTSNSNHCMEIPNGSITLSGSGASILGGLTYNSTSASNYALCQTYPGGCADAYNNGAVQFVYTFSWGTFTGSCISASLQDSFDNPCSSSSDCGFSATASDTLNNSGQLFISIQGSNGNFTAAEANSGCATDAVNSGLTGTYVALFSTSSANWGLMPNANFYNASNNVRVTNSDSNGNFYPMLINLITQPDGSPARQFWSGYAQTPSTTSTCNNWTDASTGYTGELGAVVLGVANWFAYTTNFCSSFNNWLCVSYNS